MSALLIYNNPSLASLSAQEKWLDIAWMSNDINAMLASDSKYFDSRTRRTLGSRRKKGMHIRVQDVIKVSTACLVVKEELRKVINFGTRWQPPRQTFEKLLYYSESNCCSFCDVRLIERKEDLPWIYLVDFANIFLLWKYSQWTIEMYWHSSQTVMDASHWSTLTIRRATKQWSITSAWHILFRKLRMLNQLDHIFVVILDFFARAIYRDTTSFHS